MRIERLTAQGFGTLQGLDVAFSPGLTVVFGPNEAGKSTLVELVFALLYGPFRHDTKRAIMRGEVVAKQPWDGGAFAGSLVVALGGRRLVVARDFSQPKAISVRDLDLGTDLSRNYQPGGRLEFGPQHLGLSANGFRSTALVRQGAAADLSSDDSLSVRLQNLKESGEEEISLSAARGRLEAALTTLGKSDRPGRNTEIGRLLERLSDLEGRLSAARQERDRLLAAQAELERRKEALAEAQLQGDALSRRVDGLRRRVWAKEISRRAELQGELERRAEELSRLEPFRAFSPDLASRAQRAQAQEVAEVEAAQTAVAQADEALQQLLQAERALPFQGLGDDALEGLESDGREVLGEQARLSAAFEEAEERAGRLAALADDEGVDKDSRQRARGLWLSALAGAAFLAGIFFLATRAGVEAVAAWVVAAALLAAGHPFWSPARRRGLSRRLAQQAQAKAQLSEARRQGDEVRRQSSLASERAEAFSRACGLPLSPEAVLQLRAARRERASLAAKKQAATQRVEAARQRLDAATARRDQAGAEVAALVERFGPFDAASEAAGRLAALEERRGQLREALATRPQEEASALSVSLEALVARGVEEVAGSPEDLSAAEDEAKALFADIENRRVAIESQEATLGGLKDGGPGLPELGAELLRLQGELSAKRQRRAALLEALRALDAVSEAYHKEVSPKLNRRVEAYMATVTGGARTVVVGTDLQPQLSGGGPLSLRAPSDLSQGLRDALYLAVRLSLLELMSEEQPLPVILDDPFVTLDRGRFGRLLPLLLEAAKERQVVVLTCHEREAEAFSRAGATLVTLGSPGPDEMPSESRRQAGPM